MLYVKLSNEKCQKGGGCLLDNIFDVWASNRLHA